MSSLKGKVALVTGGSKGIGKATCQALSKAGASVVINHSSDSTSANVLVEEIGSERAFAVEADAGSIEGAEEMVKATMDLFGRLDIVVANAGTSPMKNIASTTSADFDTAFTLNVKGPYFLSQKAAAVMEEGSNIVLISSSLCHFSGVMPENLLYCCCKGAIEQLTRVLSKDLARRQITVNAIAPGPVDGEHFRRGKSETLVESITQTIPEGSLGKPDEIADVITFLSGHESRWITGQVLKVNGGMTESILHGPLNCGQLLLRST